jgi:hypothetical protein
MHTHDPTSEQPNTFAAFPPPLLSCSATPQQPLNPFLKGMMGAMQQAAGQPGQPAATYMPMAPGNLMQSSLMTSDGTNSTAVGAADSAHTTQSYDPTTNTLITTTVDPATGEGWNKLQKLRHTTAAAAAVPAAATQASLAAVPHRARV